MGKMSVAAAGDAPLAVFTEGYRSYLDQVGYSPQTLRERMELFGQLSRWLTAEGLSAAGLTAAEAERFFAARRAAGQRRVPTMQSLAELFEYLRDEQVLLDQRASSPIEDLIAQYSHYLTQDRGLAPLTIVRRPSWGTRAASLRRRPIGIPTLLGHGPSRRECPQSGGSRVARMGVPTSGQARSRGSRHPRP
jgi:hypothetical protein